jgi:2Fe-2S type ferredoxin
MVDPVALGLGTGLVVVFVVLHYARGTGWEPTGDISDEVLERRASTVEETEFPEPGNRAIGGGGGVAAGAVPAGEEGELEEGGAATDDAGPGDIPDDEVEYFEVEFEKEGQTIEVSNDEPLLDQGEDDGMDLPYACRQGQCVSCAGQITSGGNAEDYVEHDNQQMLDDSELDDGYTLTCVAYPRDDFSIESGEAP